MQLELMRDNQEYINCNLCGSNTYNYLDYEGGNRIVKCRECGLVYRNPRSLSKLDRQSESERLYGDYELMEQNVSMARGGVFRQMLCLLENRVKNKPRKILDIGCGQGYFLNLAKQHNWQVYGVEPVKSACQFAQLKYGIEVVNSNLEEARFSDNYFDIVSLWNVFDHLTDPYLSAKEIHRLLKVGGYAVIRVPNVRIHLLSHKIFVFMTKFADKGKVRDPSVIINYGFSAKTISSLLKKTGFKEVQVMNSPMSSGDPYRSFKGIKVSTVDFFKEASYVFSQAIYLISFGRISLGTALLVFAKK